MEGNKSAPRFPREAQWPHPNQYDEMQNDGDLLDAFAQWVPEEPLRRQILVDNPAALYGFE